MAHHKGSYEMSDSLEMVELSDLPVTIINEIEVTLGSHFCWKQEVSRVYISVDTGLWLV